MKSDTTKVHMSKDRELTNVLISKVPDIDVDARTDNSSDMSSKTSVHLVEGTKPVHPVLWNLMIIAGVMIYGSYTILIHLCEVDGKLPFSSASTVFVTEVMKLIISITLYNTETHTEKFSIPTWRFIAPFAVPAILYCMTNNLGVHIQLQMDPATYQVLSNLKILSTGLLYRIIIKRPVSGIQWVALGMLAAAGACNGYGGLMSKPGEMSASVIHITVLGLCMILVYSFLSGLAGVYSEYILKGKYEMSIHIQNSLLYIFGVILNGSIWFFGCLHDGEGFNLFKGYSIYTWMVVIFQAVIGLIMSGIMKHASNITRLFLISCAMLVATALSVIVFHLQLNVYFCVAFVLVAIALFLYHRN